MSTPKLVGAFISACVTGPIWLYVLYQILSAIDAAPLTWFLFWVYAPAVIIVMTINVLAGRAEVEATHTRKLDEARQDLERLYQDIGRNRRPS